MDKIKKYQNIILEILKKYEETESSVKAFVIADKEQHHYQLVESGWVDKNKYFFASPIHFHINENGKISLLENQTEYDLAADLMEKGVPKKDIILSFIPESARGITGFAVS